jgi:hypothetical protein
MFRLTREADMNEDWQLRREARRCIYSAMTAPGAGERNMLTSLSIFYEALADSNVPRRADRAKLNQQTPVK